MQTLRLSAKNGWHWLSEGYRIYSKSRMMLALIVIGYWLLMMLVNSVPGLGTVVATICLPAMSVGLMNACRRIDRGEPVTPPILFSGFSNNVRALLLLGAIYLVAALAIFAVTSLVDGGTLLHLFALGESADEAVDNHTMLLASWIALLLLLPLVMAYWYAPMLAAWHGYSAGKSLFFSLFACLRNWRAFLVYVFSIIAFALVLSIVAGLVSASFPGAGRSFLMLIVGFFCLPVLYASFYVSYRDVFAAPGDDA